MTQSPSGQFLRTSTLVVLAMGALFAADTFLAKTEAKESRIESARLFKLGQSLLAEGHNTDAVDRFKDALEIERGNRDYQRALAQAELAAGQTADAEATLNDVLLNDSNDGTANLLLGRVLVKEGRTSEAISYYHRAVFGQWKDDAEGNRLKVRFELIDLLAQQDSKDELLAELLAVQDKMPDDAATHLRAGRLFLIAGSPARAADTFRTVLKAQPMSAEAYAGLGEAALATGDYRSAQSDFQSAADLNPGDPALGKRLDLASRALDLDPAVRGIGVAERFRRSQALVEMTLEAAACFGANPTTPQQKLLDEARNALKQRAGATAQDGATETNLDLAGQLWQTRKSGCQPPPDPDDPLGLVLAKTAAR